MVCCLLVLRLLFCKLISVFNLLVGQNAPSARSSGQEGPEACSRSAMAKSERYCTGNARGKRDLSLVLVLSLKFHPTHPDTDSPIPARTQDEPQTDVQPAYSYVPPGRNHLFVPGA